MLFSHAPQPLLTFVADSLSAVPDLRTTPDRATERCTASDGTSRPRSADDGARRESRSGLQIRNGSKNSGARDRAPARVTWNCPLLVRDIGDLYCTHIIAFAYASEPAMVERHVRRPVEHAPLLLWWARRVSFVPTEAKISGLPRTSPLPGQASSRQECLPKYRASTSPALRRRPSVDRDRDRRSRRTSRRRSSSSSSASFCTAAARASFSGQRR